MLITREINKPRFQTLWSLNIQYLFTIVKGVHVARGSWCARDPPGVEVDMTICSRPSL